MGAVEFVISVLLVGLSILANAAAVHRVIRERTTEGVSLVTLNMYVMGSVTWMTYGMLHDMVVQIVANSVGLVANLGILVAAYRFGELRPQRMVLAAVAYGGLIAAGCATVGVITVSIVVTLMAFVNKVPQMWESWKRPGGMGVSIPSYAMGLTSNLGWATFGLLRGDMVVLGTATYCAAFALFVALRTWHARRPQQEAIESVVLRAA